MRAQFLIFDIGFGRAAFSKRFDYDDKGAILGWNFDVSTVRKACAM